MDDRQEFTSLVRPHLAVMYRVAWRWTHNRADAEDLVQDVLLKLVTKLDRMRRVESLRPWLLKVLYRRFVDVHRHSSRSPVEAGEAAVRAVESATTPDDADALVLRRRLERALAALSDEHRDVVILCDVEGYTSAETSEILDISQGTVKSRLHRAHGKLREILDDGTF